MGVDQFKERLCEGVSSPTAHSLFLELLHQRRSSEELFEGLPEVKRLDLSEVVLTLGEVPVAPYSLPTAQGLADAVAPFVRRGRAVLMRFHGAVVFGESIEHAGQLMETLEHVAKIDTIRRSLDSTAKLGESDASELRALRAKLFGW